MEGGKGIRREKEKEKEKETKMDGERVKERQGRTEEEKE